MATEMAKPLQELGAQKKTIKEQPAAAIAAIHKAAAERTAALKANDRRLRAVSVKKQKRRENHVNIFVDAAMIQQCQTWEASAAKFKTLLEEFYSDSPEHLKAA
jgi:hypothetical protein